MGSVYVIPNRTYYLYGNSISYFLRWDLSLNIVSLEINHWLDFRKGNRKVQTQTNHYTLNVWHVKYELVYNTVYATHIHISMKLYIYTFKYYAIIWTQGVLGFAFKFKCSSLHLRLKPEHHTGSLPVPSSR